MLSTVPVPGRSAVIRADVVVGRVVRLLRFVEDGGEVIVFVSTFPDRSRAREAFEVHVYGQG